MKKTLLLSQLAIISLASTVKIFSTVYVDVSADAAQAEFLRNYADEIVWLDEDDHLCSAHFFSENKDGTTNPEVTFKEPWLSSSVKNQGTHSASLVLGNNDNPQANSTERNEIAFVRTADSFSNFFGSSRYFGFSIRLGTNSGTWDFETPSDNMMVFQVWQDVKKSSPIASLEIDPHNATSVKAQLYIRDTPVVGYNTGTKVCEFTLNKYQWYRVVVELRPSLTGNGFVQIWVNGSSMGSKSKDWGYDPSDSSVNSEKVAVKAGIYRMQQNKFHQVFLDDIKFATSYSEVD